MLGKRLSWLWSVIVLAGCESAFRPPAEPDRDERMTRGYVYYLDGAGGGGALANFAGGVRKGLLDAGYEGAGEVFEWNTGLGVVADQAASESYKREKAGELAREIAAFQQAQPEAPVTLIGLSAGTAVAVFTLEALPETARVENVILLSGSLSARHDLTRALRRVRGKMYVFSSAKDAVLGFLVPISGTADRAVGGGATIGLSGPQLPPGASRETVTQYAKVVEVPWNEEFRDYGNRGGHIDAVKAPFIQAVVAPLVLTNARPVALAAELEESEVPNPDYERWARFAPGSWAMFEGTQIINGRETSIRVLAELASVRDDHLIVNRTFEGLDDRAIAAPLSRRFVVPRTIAPENHPMLHPSSTVKEGDLGIMMLAGQRLTCQFVGCAAEGTFPEWGKEPKMTGLACADVPGGFARVTLGAKWGEAEVQIAVNLSDFGVAAAR